MEDKEDSEQPKTERYRRGAISDFSSGSYDMQRPTQVGDMFLMIGQVIFAYLFALIISGSSGVWSAAIAKRHPGIQVNASRIIRIVVCIVLIVPVVLRVLAG